MAHIEGKAVYVNDISEGKERVWLFRLIESRDEKSRPLPEIQVEIRGKHLKGQINDGDRILIKEKFKKGKIFSPKKVFNVTVGAEVGQK
jgi:hypothetical protein